MLLNTFPDPEYVLDPRLVCCRHCEAWVTWPRWRRIEIDDHEPVCRQCYSALLAEMNADAAIAEASEIVREVAA